MMLTHQDAASSGCTTQPPPPQRQIPSPDLTTRISNLCDAPETKANANIANDNMTSRTSMKPPNHNNTNHRHTKRLMNIAQLHRKFVFALTTFRLSNWCTHQTLLKSLHVCAYCCLAILSFVVLILYINKHLSANQAIGPGLVAQLQSHNKQDGDYLLKPIETMQDKQARARKGKLTYDDQHDDRDDSMFRDSVAILTHIFNAKHRASDDDGSARALHRVARDTKSAARYTSNRVRMARTAARRLVAARDPRDTTTRRPAQRPPQRLQPAHNRQRPSGRDRYDLELASSDANRSQLPELSARHATYSTNNRGKLAQNETRDEPKAQLSAPTLSGGGWTPIAYSQPAPPLRRVPAPPGALAQGRARDAMLAAAAAYEPLRYRWRRPRLHHMHHAPPKIYKRVLLCDKTMVSLDYVRFAPHQEYGGGGGGKPRGYYHLGPNDELLNEYVGLDNAIELNEAVGVTRSPPSVVYLERRAAPASVPSVAAATNASLDASATTETASTAAPIAAAASTAAGDADLASAASNADTADLVAKRLYGGKHFPPGFLDGEGGDLLIKCDMWDLEKGLKNRKPPEELVHMAVRADFDTVREAINKCRQLSERSLPPDDELRDGSDLMSMDDLVSLFSMKRGLIPGTKWCGLGDQASTYNDLGPKHRIDVCCRAHDHCPIRLKPFRNDYGVLNIALYTKSHCDCDADFYRCLREAHSRTADMLGNLYFNVMKLQCMREVRVKACREAKPIALGFERCVRYEESPRRTVFKFTTPPVAY